MPKIGMRMIKTSIAVFICFVVYTLWDSGSVFYSVIAAILCMQTDIESGYRVGLNRIIGTFIGGCVGMAVLAVETWLYNLHNLPYLFFAAIISIMLIPVIYITLIFKKSTASFIACVVFLSITVMHGFDVNPFYFAINRIMDTLIGIFISLLVNSVHLPRIINREILFVADLDSVFLNSQGRIDPYVRVKLNQLLKKQMNLVLFTSKSAPSVAPLVKDLALHLPLFTMRGAALYQMQTHHYQKTIPLSREIADTITELSRQENLTPFSFTVQNDMLHIYHASFSNPGEIAYYRDKRIMPLIVFVENSVPPDEDPIRIRLIDRKEKLKNFIDVLINQPFANEICWELSPSSHRQGYFHLDIYNTKRNTPIFLEELKKQNGCDKIAIFIKTTDEDGASPLESMAESVDIVLKETQSGKNTIKSIKKMERAVTSDHFLKKYQ